MVLSAYSFSGDSHRIVCSGRRRNVVCHCRGHRTKPGVLITAVLIAVAGFTGLSWAVSVDATATQHSAAAAVEMHQPAQPASPAHS